MECEFHPAMEGYCIILDNTLYRLTGDFVYIDCCGLCPMCEDLTNCKTRAYPIYVKLDEKMFDSESRISILESVL